MIEDIRKEIDCIDDEIANLFEKRLEKVKQIGLQKQKTNTMIYSPQREKEILNRVTKGKSEEQKLYIKNLFENIMFQSKSYQRKYVSCASKIADKIKQSAKDGYSEFPISASVACQGVDGAYSGIAAEKLFELSDITYFKNFEGVFNAVDKGLCEYGVLPIENSTAGSVLAVYDLMKKHSFYIVKSVRMQISHVLAVKSGGTLDKIKTIYSHEQAISQCNEYIKKLSVDSVCMENTAVAAKMVSSSEDDTIACICSEKCARLYGLKVLEKGIQDNANNFTRFICISKDLRIIKGADKISIMTSLENKPGSLNKTLSLFASEGLNLSKLESRPIPNCQFEFMFYFDFEGDIAKDGVINLIAELDNNSDKFAFLGAYKEIL